MEPIVEFEIIPGVSREVERSKKVPTSIFFSVPTLPFPREEIRVQVKEFVLVLKWSANGRNCYATTRNELGLHQYGRLDSERVVNFDHLIQNISAEDLCKAFRLAGEKIIAENFPPGATDISTGAPPVHAPIAIDISSRTPPTPHVPILYKFEPAHTERWTETVHGGDDIFFRICGIEVVDKQVSIETEKLNIVFDLNDSEPGHYLETRKECPDRNRLDLNSFGYCSDSFKHEHHVAQLREDVSDEDIEAAFQALALKLIEASESRIAKGKRKAPPSAPKVWSRSTVTEVQLAKRLKESTLDSE